MVNYKKGMVVAIPAAAIVSAVAGCSNTQVIEYHNQETNKETFEGNYATIINDILDNGNIINHSNYFMCFYRITKSNKNYLRRYFNIYDLQDYSDKWTLNDYIIATNNMKPTYEMVIGSLDQNDDLGSYKELIKNTVLDVNKKYPNLDLSLLMYNAPTLKIREVYVENYFYGKYNPYTNTIIVNARYANNNTLKETAVKTALGYCYTNGFIKENSVLCSDSENYIYIDYMSGNSKDIIEGGKTFKDGFAACITNDVIDTNIYPELAEDVGIFRFILECNEMTIEQYEKEGFNGLINRMMNNGLNEMIRHLVRLDDPNEKDNKCSVTCKIEDIYWRYLKNQGYSDEESQKILEDKIRRSFEGITLDKNNALFQITGIRELLIWMEQHVMPKQKTR